LLLVGDFAGAGAAKAVPHLDLLYRHRRSHHQKTPDLQYALEPTIASLCLPASLQVTRITTPIGSSSIRRRPVCNNANTEKHKIRRVQEHSDPSLFLYHSPTVLSNVRYRFTVFFLQQFLERMDNNST
jgi:hypothetical protein